LRSPPPPRRQCPPDQGRRSIENLAADIARRGLLQSLSARPILNEAGEETGFYGVQAGGRRLRALQLFVKQKKLAKNAPVPCIVRTEGFVEADCRLLGRQPQGSEDRLQPDWTRDG